jgi:ribonuclease P protein component
MKSLKRKSEIERLFSKEATKINTLSIRARVVSGEGEILISVPSKTFKRAVDRNRLKRLIRESLKSKILTDKNLGLIYSRTDIIGLKEIQSDIDRIFSKLDNLKMQ